MHRRARILIFDDFLGTLLMYPGHSVFQGNSMSHFSEGTLVYMPSLWLDHRSTWIKRGRVSFLSISQPRS